MRKSGILQCRSWKTTCCLVTSPFFFCILVFSLQMLLNILVLSRPDNQVRSPSPSWFYAAPPWFLEHE